VTGRPGGAAERRTSAGVPSSHPPHVLREYALLADGERGAIVGPRGDIVWMCAPRWESDAVFSALIGGRSAYAVTPDERHVWGGYYEDASMVWRHRWTTTSGIVECRDALAVPGDPSYVVLLRQIRAVDCSARVAVVLEPRAGYDQHPMRDLRRHEHIWTAQVGPLSMRWTGASGARPRRNGEQLLLGLRLDAGEVCDLALELSDGPLPDCAVDADRAWRDTQAGWERAAPTFHDGLAPHASRRSYAVLRGLTSATGGMVAATTTSLPERAEAGRNYDYRYVWIRDQCYAGLAGAAAGAEPLLDDAVSFVSARLLEHGDRLAPAYATNGAAVPDQRHLDLDGYPGGHDIIGNWVNQQFQLDAFGEALQLFAAAARADRVDADHWQAAEAAARAIERRWTEPDAGIWEVEQRAWTHSRLTAAGGLRAIAEVSPGSGRPEWIALADRITAETSATALHQGGRWQRAPDDPGLDAALLLPGMRGAVPSDDPRTTTTLGAYLAELTEEGYAYRYRHGERALGEVEGSFLLCGFLVALALHQQGDVASARAWFERTRAATGPPELFSEEYDGTQHQMRGNLPQAFVHALLLETAARLARGPSRADRLH